MTRHKPKNFFAQSLHSTPEKCVEMYFDNLAEAVAWLKVNGGGTVKQRGIGSVVVPGLGKIKSWGVVKVVKCE